MKTKRKEKEKRRKEKKRSEDKKVSSGIELGTINVPDQSFTTRPRGKHKLNCQNFIIKTFEPYYSCIQRYFSEE